MSTNPPPSANPPPNWGSTPPSWDPANQVKPNPQAAPPPPPPPDPGWQSPQAPPPPGWSGGDAWNERRFNRHRGSGWIWGLGLVALGVIFLLQNFGIFIMNNWWAIFILIPAVGSFVTMVFLIQTNGRFTPTAASSLTGGLLLTFIACVFFFNWNWSSIWPFFLIIIGVGALVTAMFRR